MAAKKSPKVKEIPPNKDGAGSVVGTLMDHFDSTLVILGPDRIIYRFSYNGGVYGDWEPGLVVRAYFEKTGIEINVHTVEAI